MGKHQYGRDIADLNERLKVIKDRVRGVANSTLNGVYLYGRAGTSKTFTVTTTLDELGVRYSYSNGQLTPVGLFELIAENRDRTIVLDDVSSIFRQPLALPILLAALGSQSNGARTIRYKKAKRDETVHFTGGIVAISNLSLESHTSGIIQALNDRIYLMNYNPSDDQMVALMYHIAQKGTEKLSSADCMTVFEFLVGELKSREIRPTIRLFVDKALKDYELWKLGQTETHWRDLIISNLEQQFVELKHTSSVLGRAEQKEIEQRVAADLFTTHETSGEAVLNWELKTGKSQSAFYRRLREAKQKGLMS